VLFIFAATQHFDRFRSEADIDKPRFSLRQSAESRQVSLAAHL
jgi:hypothetical protein